MLNKKCLREEGERFLIRGAERYLGEEERGEEGGNNGRLVVDFASTSSTFYGIEHFFGSMAALKSQNFFPFCLKQKFSRDFFKNGLIFTIDHHHSPLVKKAINEVKQGNKIFKRFSTKI